MAYRNAFDIVNQVNNDYPGLINKSDGYFVDQVAHRLNKLDQEIRWGRKKKNSGEMNIDVLAYLNDLADWSKKIMVDIIIDSETPRARVGWQEYLGDNLGNGSWVPPIQPDLDPVIQSPEPTRVTDSSSIGSPTQQVIELLVNIRDSFNKLIEIVEQLG